MFTQKSFGPISSHGNSDMPNIWTYTTSDSSAVIMADDYFKPKHPIMNDGDLIYAQPSDTPVFGKLRKTADGFTIDPLIGPGSLVGNEIIITKVEDFDNFDDTTITLTDGFTYKVNGDVDIGTRCIVYSGSVVLKSNNTTDNSIISACPTAMITGDGSYKLSELALVSTVGPIYDITLTAPSIIIMENFSHKGGMGQITGFTGSAFFSDLGSIDSEISPLSFKGDWTRIDLADVFPAGVAIETGETMAVFDTGIVVTERILIGLSYSIIDTGGVAYQFNDITGLGNESVQISDNNFTGAGAPLAGITNDDNELFAKGNIGINDTLPNGVWRIDNNALVTAIAVIDTPVVINATVDEINLQRFTIITSPNKLTYTGAKARAFRVEGTFVLETSANNQRIGAVVQVNGSDTSVIFTTTTSGSGGTRIDNLNISGTVVLDEGDEVQVAVFNTTSTDNITVLDGVFQMVAIN